MRINNKEIILDKQLYDSIQSNYRTNINMFSEQNSGLIIEDIKSLSEYDILKFIVDNVDVEDGTTIDNKFINSHFVSFAINPIVDNITSGYTNKVDIIPDIICESIKA